MHKTWALTLVLLLGGGWLLRAQDWSERNEAMQKRIEERMQAQQERINLAFDNQMKRIWINMNLEQEAPPPLIEPDIPKAFAPDQAPQLPLEPRQIITLEPEVQVAADPEVFRQPSAEPLAPVPTDVADGIAMLEQEASADYYGQSLSWRYDPRMRFNLSERITEHRVAESWKRLEGTDYELLVYQLTRYAQQYQLNDWGYTQLVASAAKQINPYDKNARVLLQWFLLSQSGYVATVGYERDHLHLLLPTQQRLYGKTFVRGKEHKLYALDLEGDDLDVRQAHIFPNHYPEATRIMDLRITQAPKLAPRIAKRTVNFTYRGRDYHIPFEFNRNVVDFYNSYPFVDLSIYLNAPVSYEARASLVTHLKQEVRKLKPHGGHSRYSEGVNFLLHFVQAMPYQTDHEQFGGERYLFADEVLAFPASDCEDRSVLFAYLVREILGLEVVGLLYPGHAAAAVHFPRESVPGDWVQYRGKKYVVCDPSYIGADLGRALPQAASQMAKVVGIN